MGAYPNDTTRSSGRFTLRAWDAHRDPAYYPYLFAYKTGYKLWRYDQKPIPVTAISDMVDTVRILLEPL